MMNTIHDPTKKTPTLFQLSHRFASGPAADRDAEELTKLLPLDVDVPVTMGDVDEYGWRSMFVRHAGDVRIANAYVAGWYKGRARGY